MRDGEATRSAAAFQLLQRASVAVRSQVDLRRVLDTLVADVGRFLDLRLCALARWDSSGTCLVFSHEYVREAGTLGSPSLQGRRFVPGTDPAARAFEHLVLKDQRTLIRYSSARSQASAGSESAPPPPAGRAHQPGEADRDAASAPLLAGMSDSAILVAPIVADQRVAGLIVTARAMDLPDWAESEVEFTRAAADAAAVAIQHAALRSRLRALSATAAELNSTFDVKPLLKRLTEAAISVTNSGAGFVGLVEADAIVIRERCRNGAWVPMEMRFTRDRGLSGWCWSNRAPCISNDSPADPRADADFVRLHAVRNALTVPIVDRQGTVLGIFQLHNKAGGAPFGEDDVHIATALAHHAAVALELHRR